ncbi:MAG: hypothetical protein J6W08_01425 [Alphaproteobacteria bacterium]|nr:hypothetical protein [Alphaproteobacteria bacterium]
MKLLKKFCMMFVAMFPLAAGAIAPIVVGGIAAGVGILGMSIWRTASPVNMQEALDFFSSCWTCQMFSDIMLAMSNLLPGVFKSIGQVVIPMSATLLALLIAWRITVGFLNNKMEDASKMAGNFGTYLVKLTVVVGLLLLPLPRMVTEILVEPTLAIGTSFDGVVSDNKTFSECMVATAIVDPMSVSAEAADYGAFSPKARHQLTCEVAQVHQVTGLGMTVGWTMLNMAFNTKYMHKILWKIPVFPNVPLFFAGLLVLVLFFYSLLPIPLFFLEIFVKLSMDLIMLPLMLMSWLFDEDEFALFPKGGRTIRQMMEDLIKGMVGIVITIVFLVFLVMFLNAAFGSWTGADVLQQAIAQNDSEFFMDSLMMQNNSLITVLLMGVFIAMFMTSIPQLTSMLFKVQISDKYYQTAKKDLKIVWNGIKKLIPNKDKNKAGSGSASSSVAGASGGGGSGAGSSGGGYTRLKYIESDGTQYINTGISPSNGTEINIKADISSRQSGSRQIYLFGSRDGVAYNSFAMEVFYGSNSASAAIEYGSSNDNMNVGTSITGKKIYLGIKGTDWFVDNRTKNLPNETFSASNNLYLLSLNDRGFSTGECSCKIYSCEIKENGSVVRNFIPVLDGNGVPCLYDTVRNTFYYNERTGKFKAGPAE